MATEDPISERTGLIRRTTLGRNDFVQDDAPENPTLKVKLTDYGRESADGLPPLPPKPPKRFKTVSTLVIAMNRFKASLNPTYTFGKRTDSQGSFNSSGRESPEISSPQGSSALISQPAEAPDSGNKVYSSRGHKTSYLLRPLPPAESEQRSRGTARYD